MSKSIMEMRGIPRLKLRKVTRAGQKCEIELCNSLRHPEKWITCGRLTMSYMERSNQWHVGARLGRGATDGDHDSSWAFRFSVIGLKLELMHSGNALFSGYIATPIDNYDYSDLCIPDPDWDPFAEESLCDDPHCGEAHPIVAYLPDSNKEMYDKLAGLPIRIWIYPDED